MHGGPKRGFHSLTRVSVDPFFFYSHRDNSIIIISNLEFCLYTTGISPNPSILLRISTTIPYYAVHCFCTYY